jgi:hypothetical protein
MSGDRVIVRGFRGKARICRVVNVSGETAQLTDNEGFDAISKGEDTEKIVTFRLADLFVDDGTVRNDTVPRWEGLKPYSAKILHKVSN